MITGKVSPRAAISRRAGSTRSTVCWGVAATAVATAKKVRRMTGPEDPATFFMVVLLSPDHARERAKPDQDLSRMFFQFGFPTVEFCWLGNGLRSTLRPASIRRCPGCCFGKALTFQPLCSLSLAMQRVFDRAHRRWSLTAAPLAARRGVLRSQAL